MATLEKQFKIFRKGIVGRQAKFRTPYGKKKMIYADWVASGRLYRPIEDRMLNHFGPYVGNTHTETTITGRSMTQGYHEARDVIKRHVHAGSDDVLIATGSGMTGAVNKLQRIMGLKLSKRPRAKKDRPVVFVTHMEHHSNHISWLETIADVEVIPPDQAGLPDLDALNVLLKKYKTRRLKIASVTAGSNVTGLSAPYYDIAEIMHGAGGYCFVDFACAGPYVKIDMHPKNLAKRLDAIFLSPHKFLGGPGTPGILVFSKDLYPKDKKGFPPPDHPGGGTVCWTNPWGGRRYYDDIETREDGGTPPFLGVIKTALAIKLKEEMQTNRMLDREKEMLGILWPKLDNIPNIKVLAGDMRDRLGVISIIFEKLHYNLAATLLNDRFGVQTRGGCACAGTYGHYLLNISKKESKEITKRIDLSDLSRKPGFVRLSVHPTMTDKDMMNICEALKATAINGEKWRGDYRYEKKTNEWRHLKYKKAPAGESIL